MTMPFGPMRQAVIVGGSQRLYDAPGGAPIVPVDPPDPDPDVVASVSVSPISFSVVAGLDVQALTATPRTDLGVVVAGKTATWASSDSGVASVASTGNLAAAVTGVSAGTATITATVDGINGTSAATVTAVVATVTVGPSVITLTAPATQAVSATVLDSGGLPLTGRSINWATTDAGVATVTAGVGYDAVVAGVGAGTATITATVEGVFGTAVATVSASVTFITETFEDSNFTSRGWYDMGGSPVIDPVNPHSGFGCVRFTWSPGNSLPDTGWAARRLFTPTDRVYIEYWVRFSSNWSGSGLVFNPHEWQIVTTEDSAFVGPASTRLTALVQSNYQSGIVGHILATDQVNIDNSNIGVDRTGVTEVRATQGCNGFLETTHTKTSCFDGGGGIFQNSREWHDTTVSISDAEKTNWHKVGAYFQLNTVSGGIGQQDGIIRYWVDDVLKMSHTGVVLRTGQYPNMLFNQLLMIPSMGSGGSPSTQSVWYDDLTVDANPPPTGGGTPDLLNNASFETGWDGFTNNSGGLPDTINATIERSTEQSFSGSWSVKSTNPTSSATRFNYLYGVRGNVYVRIYYYALNHPTTATMKWIRFQTPGFGGVHGGLYTNAPGTPPSWLFDDSSPGNINNFLPDVTPFNQWNYWEINYDSVNGRVRFWHNGAVVIAAANPGSNNFNSGDWLYSGGGGQANPDRVVINDTTNAGSGVGTYYYDRIAISTQRIGA